MQAIRQIVDAEKLCQIVDMPDDMRRMQVEIIVFPAKEYSDEYYYKDFESTVEELQKESIENGNNNMTMEEINAEIALYRRERAERKVK